MSRGVEDVLDIYTRTNTHIHKSLSNGKSNHSSGSITSQIVNITTRDIYPHVSHEEADWIHLSDSLNPGNSPPVKIYFNL